MLGILALLTDHRRPTVAEALKIGASKILSYLAAYLLLGLAFGLIAIALVGGLAATGSVGASVVGIFASVVLLAYFFTKFSLVPPVLVKEGISNPITALARSWQLTKGNSLRLFGFFFLLIIALSVVMIVISMVVTFTLSLLGTEAMMFGSGLVSGTDERGLGNGIPGRPRLRAQPARRHEPGADQRNFRIAWKALSPPASPRRAGTAGCSTRQSRYRRCLKCRAVRSRAVVLNW